MRPPIRLPPAHRNFIRQELATARTAGLIQTGASPWSSPSFVVPKPWSTKLRVVLDYRWLNAQTIRDSYPLPHIPKVLEAVGAHTFFNKLDLKSGFWQVPLHPDSELCTGFSHPDGADIWKVVPMGLCNGPPHFQQCVNVMLQAAGPHTKVGAFIDDLANWGCHCGGRGGSCQVAVQCFRHGKFPGRR